jgi:chromosomal replication initiation ATPase DnaA
LLLHLYNLTLERGGSLLLTMSQPPAALPVGLADLASRLRALPVAGITPLDDALLGALLVKHFADRQLRVAPGVFAYLVPRIERSFAAAAAIAARLDQLALETGRPVTTQLARVVLAEISG